MTKRTLLKPKPTNSITISVYFNEELLAGLRRKRQTTGRSMSQIIRELVRKDIGRTA